MQIQEPRRTKGITIMISRDQNDLLKRLADIEDRTKVDEIIYLVKKRLRELETQGG